MTPASNSTTAGTIKPALSLDEITRQANRLFIVLPRGNNSGLAGIGNRTSGPQGTIVFTKDCPLDRLMGKLLIAHRKRKYVVPLAVLEQVLPDIDLPQACETLAKIGAVRLSAEEKSLVILFGGVGEEKCSVFKQYFYPARLSFEPRDTSRLYAHPV